MVARLTELRRPFIVAVIVARTAAGVAGALARASLAGADAFELNLPLIFEDELEATVRHVSSSSRPVYTSARRSTFMSIYGRGEVPEWSEDERVERQMQLLAHGSVAIDIELDAFDSPQPLGVSEDAGARARQLEIAGAAHAAGKEVLYSCHATRSIDRHEALTLVEHARDRGGDLAKIVAPVQNEYEALELLFAAVDVRLRSMPPTTIIAAGKRGGFTRLISPVLGASWAVCQERIEDGGFAEQPPITEAREALRILSAFHPVSASSDIAGAA